MNYELRFITTECKTIDSVISTESSREKSYEAKTKIPRRRLTRNEPLVLIFS